MHEASVSCHIVVLYDGNHARGELTVSFDIEKPFEAEMIIAVDFVRELKLWTVPLDMIMRAVYLGVRAEGPDCALEPLRDRVLLPLRFLPDDAMLLTLHGEVEGIEASAHLIIGHDAIRLFCDKANDAISRSPETLPV